MFDHFLLYTIDERHGFPSIFSIISGPGQDLFGGAERNFSRRAFFDVHAEHPFMDLIEESSLGADSQVTVTGELSSLRPQWISMVHTLWYTKSY